MRQLQFLIITFLFGCISLVGQPGDAQLGDVSLPSADGFSNGIALETTVNPLTGVPSYGVHIYEIRHNRLSLPISLSYNFSGIHVTDPASRVEMGWTLNAGGMVTRSVQGIPDESANGVLKHTGPISANNVASGLDDAEADIFSYSFGGQGGKFTLEKSVDGLSLSFRCHGQTIRLSRLMTT